MPLVNAKYHLCPWKDKRPNDSTATTSWLLVALLLAPLGTRGARSPRPPPAGSQNRKTPPPSDLGRRSSNGAPRRCKLLVNRLLSLCRRRSRAWSNGLVAIVRSRWHLAIVAHRQLAGLSVNRCDVRGSVQLCADACGFDHDVATQSETCHGQDVACVQDGAAEPAASCLGPKARA